MAGGRRTDRFVPRARLLLAIRDAVDATPLRSGIAAALALPVEGVRLLTDDADPPVRYEVRRWDRGFAMVLDIFIDPARLPVPAIPILAVRLAASLGGDVAHHDGSADPYGYVLVRPDGRRFAASEIDDGDAWLILDEGRGRMTELPPLP